MKDKRLTLTRARTLVKRELGINPTALEKTPGMNDNPRHPYFSMKSGNLSITVFTNEYCEFKIIGLRLSFRDGLGSINRYFYADDLTEATELMEGLYWEDNFDRVKDKGREPMSSRLSRQAKEACRKHFGNQH